MNKITLQVPLEFAGELNPRDLLVYSMFLYVRERPGMFDMGFDPRNHDEMVKLPKGLFVCVGTWVAKKLNVTPNTVYKAILSLVDKGFIVREGEGVFRVAKLPSLQDVERIA